MHTRSMIVVGLFAASVFSLVWRQGNVLLFPLPKLFEVLILVLTVYIVFHWKAIAQDTPRLRAYASVTKKYYIPTLILLVSPIAGLLWSAWVGLDWRQFFVPAVVEYARIIFVIFFFYLAMGIALWFPRAIHAGIVAIAMSSLVLWIALVPWFQELFLIEGRLRGAGNDPNYLATWIMVGFLISLSLYLYGRRFRTWWLVNAALLAPLILWTGSRSTWVVCALAALVLAAKYLYEHLTVERARRVFSIVLLLGGAVVLGFFSFPLTSQRMIVDRGLGIFLSNEARTEVHHFLLSRAQEDWQTDNDQTKIITESTENFLTYGQDRPQLWRNAVSIALTSPLGYGPAYYYWQPVGMSGAQRLGPHNLFLETVLTGGWLALAALAFLVWSASKIGYGLLRGSPDPLLAALGFSWFALLGTSLFLDMLTLRWLWLLFAFLIVQDISSRIVGDSKASLHELHELGKSLMAHHK